MKMPSLMTRIAIAGTIALSSIVGAVNITSAQNADWTDMDYQPDHFESQVSDFTVDISGNDFEITGASESTYEGGQGEMVLIESPGALVEVDFFDDDFSAEEDINLWMNSFDDFESVEEVDSQFADEGGWALYRVEDPELSVPHYYFIIEYTDVSGRVDVMESIWSPEEQIVDELSFAQTDITISDHAFMENVAPADLEALMGGDSTPNAATPDAVATPERGR